MPSDRDRRKREKKQARRRQKRERREQKRRERGRRMHQGHAHAGPSVSIESAEPLTTTRPAYRPEADAEPAPRPVAPGDPVFEPRPEPEPARERSTPGQRRRAAARPVYRTEAEPIPAPIAPRDLVLNPRRAAEPAVEPAAAPESEYGGRFPPAEGPTAGARPGSTSTVSTTQRPRRSGRRGEPRKPSSWTGMLIMGVIGLAILLGLMVVNRMMQSPPSRPGADIGAAGSSSNGFGSLYPAPAVATEPPAQVRIGVGEISLLIPADWRFRTESEGRALVFTAAPSLANYDALSNPDDPPFIATGLTVRIFRVSTNRRLDAHDLDDYVQAELGHATFDRCRLDSHDSLFDFPEEITAAGAMRRHTCDTGYEVVETMGIERADPAWMVHTRMVANPDAMAHLIGTPDSVRRWEQ